MGVSLVVNETISHLCLVTVGSDQKVANNSSVPQYFPQHSLRLKKYMIMNFNMNE